MDEQMQHILILVSELEMQRDAALVQAEHLTRQLHYKEVEISALKARLGKLRKVASDLVNKFYTNFPRREGI